MLTTTLCSEIKYTSYEHINLLARGALLFWRFPHVSRDLVHKKYFEEQVPTNVLRSTVVAEEAKDFLSLRFSADVMLTNVFFGETSLTPTNDESRKIPRAVCFGFENPKMSLRRR
jgi:hypothetical protein